MQHPYKLQFVGMLKLFGFGGFDKLQLGGAGEVFDSGFGAGGGGPVFKFFGINHFDRLARKSIPRAQLSAIMLANSSFQICSDSGV